MGNQQNKDKSQPVPAIPTVATIDGCSSDDSTDADFWRGSSISSTDVAGTGMSSFSAAPDSRITFVVVQKDYSVMSAPSPVCVRKGERVRFKGYSADGQWASVERIEPVEAGWVPVSVIGDPFDDTDGYLQQYKWYHGEIPRSFAEYLLNSGITGSFLVRESESNRRLRSISLRYEGKIWHFRISRDVNGKFYVAESQRFDTIPRLIEYHSKYADGLPCQLLYPAPKRAQATVFGLQEDSGDTWEIDRTEIMMKQQLGGGQYGIVYEGFWTRHGYRVAVKTVKTDVTVADDFLEEARLMKSLQHPNLVRLLGVCTREPPNYIITEFMENGNLLDYLRNRPKEELLPPVLLYMAIQISAGMAYLEEHNFIHRDLAARNCLVGQDNIVKVADFGLARCMERDDTYTAHAGAKFPIKWTAPEGLAYNLFSTKSDVWAFGVLLWELATYGMTPYPGIELQDVFVYLQKGNIMGRPAGCPENIYDLMKKCWCWQPEDRPTFKQLHSGLEEMLSNINEQIELEIAKESGRKGGGITEHVLTNPNFPQTAISSNKKGPPTPPVRTTPLKDLSLTASFTVSNSSLMEQSISEDFPCALSDDDCLPPPPDDILSHGHHHSHSNNNNTINSHIQILSSPAPVIPTVPPSVSRNKPVPVLHKNGQSPQSGKKGGFLPFCRKENISGTAVGGSSGYHSLEKPTAQSSSASVKRTKSDRCGDGKPQQPALPSEKDLQTELKSRLKLHSAAEGIDVRIENRLKEDAQARHHQQQQHSNGGTIAGGLPPFWPARKSMGHVVDVGGNITSEQTGSLGGLSSGGIVNTILTPSSKRMSWNGPANSTTVVGTKRTPNFNPLPSLSSSNLFQEEGEGDTDEFLNRDVLINELAAVYQELSVVRGSSGGGASSYRYVGTGGVGSGSADSGEVLSAIIEKLETIHLGSTRFGNSAVSAPKIKFRIMEQCSNLSRSIENLRRCVKPYNGSSATDISTGIRAILSDLRSLIETNN